MVNNISLMRSHNLVNQKVSEITTLKDLVAFADSHEKLNIYFSNGGLKVNQIISRE